MSLVYITHHNENVMDYEKVGEVEAEVKKLKYNSMHKERVKRKMNQPYITRAPDGWLLITDAGKHEHRTMGTAVIPMPPTKCFLRKNQGLKWKRLHDHKCPEKRNLPPIPKVSELPPKKICAPKVKAKKSEHTMMETEEPPLEEMKIVIECREDKPDAFDPCRISNDKGDNRESDPCKYVYAPVPCEKDDEVKVILHPTPCPPVRESTKAKPCRTAREFKEGSRGKPCVSSREPKETSRARPCASAREIRQTSVEQPCRTKGGLENLRDKKSGASVNKSNDPCKTKNFIAHNIKRIKNSQTKLPPPRYIDTPQGDTHNLINSGLLPQFICGKNFAKVPCYIEEHKKIIKKYKEACAPEIMATQDCEEFLKRKGVRKMTLEERVALLAGLKANYMEQLKIFQTLSLYTDTPTKRLRKGRLEKDLDQLEMDIKFIQDNVDIYVSEC